MRSPSTTPNTGSEQLFHAVELSLGYASYLAKRRNVGSSDGSHNMSSSERKQSVRVKVMRVVFTPSNEIWLQQGKTTLSLGELLQDDETVGTQSAVV
eukprot:gene8679-biopygen14796